MVDNIVTKQQLIDAGKNADSWEKYWSGNEDEDVITRLNKEYPTHAKALKILMENGGIQPFETQAQLLASVPVVSPTAAKALDTKKVWIWKNGAWIDTGLSELDQAKDYTNQNLDGVSFNTDDDYKWLYAVVDEASQVMFGMDLNKVMRFISTLQAEKIQTNDSSFEDVKDADLFNILDKDNNKLMTIDQQLLAKFVSIFANKLSVQDMMVETLSTTDNPVTIVDKDGYIIGYYQADGIYNSIGSTSSGLVGIEPEQRINTDYLHVSMQGQSLALGLGAGSIATLSSEAPNALVPSAGIEDGVQGGDMQGVTGLPLSSSSVVAFNPALNPNQTAESPLYAAIVHLQKSIDERSVNSQVLGSTNGHGGTAISGLSKGTAIYDVGVAQSKAYRDYASASGKSCLSQFVLWVQGETDISNGLSGDEYIIRLNKLIADYQTDINQDLAPIMLTYQTGSHTKRWPTYSPEIPHAQLKAANTNRSIKMACATYVMPYNSDGIHMPPNSYRWLGAYFGKVMDWMLTTGRTDWKPVQPEAIYRNGRVVTIKFHVPVKPLVFDTALVTDPGNYGFKVFDAANTDLAISSVSIVNQDTVKIVLSAAPISNITVKYALGTNNTNAGPTTGARGNLRDSDATVAKVLDLTTGQPYPLQNWCPIFSLQEGFSWVQ
ncbi:MULTISPECIES: sialate O-acetylesterase [Acinetobacter]|uniref:sialate O-acetylesterase n=1 Tax=Acinetobacter TaxID=469 RepID=UPI00148B62BB|nr:sialate O-acetylesterase [Acinetobacter sp. MYb10]QLD61373.1 hypothetical protein CQZ96_008865 [Acinetobacter sp. MYb10]